jgi:alpha-L-rhamnosidase
VPGYGYQLAKGATALTESWAALPTASNNHFMLGHIMEWFYRGLVGIEQADSSIGLKQLVISPRVVGDVTWVKGNHETPYGIAKSEWKKRGKKFVLNVSIPANSSALIKLPPGKKISEGKFIFKKKFDKDQSLIPVGSGSYSFHVKQ